MPGVTARTMRHRGPRRAHGHAWAIAGAGATVLLLAGGLAVGAGWYFSARFERDVLSIRHDPDEFRLRVEALTDETIRLDTTDDPDGDWSQPGVYGLEWSTGYGKVGVILAAGEGSVTRSFTLLMGQPPSPGTAARIDTFAFPGDPAQGPGLAYEEVTIEGALGPMPAWFIDAPGDTWAVLVHGHGSRRREMLRLASVLHELGLKCLVITYRNDEGAPRDPEGRHHHGAEEWHDLEAAVDFASARGSAGVVLGGNSMGGAVVMAFLERSGRAAEVRAVILDSPLLDLGRTVRWRARDVAPSPLIRYGMWFSALRFGLDWDDYNYLADVDRLNAPILVFHGDGDDRAPLFTSQELAASRPDLVRLVSWSGVRHVQSWNHDPEGFTAEVRRFIEGAGGMAR